MKENKTIEELFDLMQRDVEMSHHLSVAYLVEIKKLIQQTKDQAVKDYRLSLYKGLQASKNEDTFDRTLGTGGGHKCCGSNTPWRHKVHCKKAPRNAPDDLSDLK